MRERISIVLRIAAALAGLAASAWSAVLGCADYWARQDTPASIQKALTLTPGRSDYYVRLGLLLSDENPTRSMEYLRRSVAVNPSDAASWIELGLAAETSGDYASAQRLLFRAAAVDNKYLPRWTLANYYFRRSDPDNFWRWTKSAAAMLYGDPRPLFRLCGHVSEDGKLMDRLGIRDPEVESAYLAYLLGQNRMDLIEPAVGRLLEHPREEDVAPLLAALDGLIQARRVDAALGVWNRLARARKIDAGLLDPGKGVVLTNGDFTSTPLLHGFDWRLPKWNGISASREERPAGLRLTFSGRQPQNCEPLFRFVPVRENTDYELTASYRTAGIPPGSGLAWSVTSFESGEVLASSENLSSEDDAQVRVRFSAPSGCKLARLALQYRRPLGATRIEGTVILRVALQPANAPAQPSRVM